MNEQSFEPDPLQELRGLVDSAAVNNIWSGGHGNAGWEAIEIAI